MALFLSKKAHRRGAAVLELALLLPVLVVAALFSVLCIEVIDLQLKVQEMARFAGFEMTSHALTDFEGQAADRHAAAFNEATRDVERRVQRMPGVAMEESSGFALTHEPLMLQLKNQRRSQSVQRLDVDASSMSVIAALPERSLSPLLHRLGFDSASVVEAEVKVVAKNHLVPRHLLDGARGFYSVDAWGGAALDKIPLRGSFTLLASGGHLADGSDARMSTKAKEGPRAGVRSDGTTHSLHRQVSRMVFFGAATDETDGHLSSIRSALDLPGPQAFGAYVVSHNYGLRRSRVKVDCESGEGGSPAHPAAEGLNDPRAASSIDHPTRRCFDTTPFRDRQEYAASQSVQLFKARGAYFMGCKKPMVDDPSEGSSPAYSRGDSNRAKRSCE